MRKEIRQQGKGESARVIARGETSKAYLSPHLLAVYHELRV